VRREFLQRLYAALHCSLDSYLRDALQVAIADDVACLLILELRPVGIFPPFPLLIDGFHYFFL
jgi:hypothetical protein